MGLKAPSFWFDGNSALAKALMPFSCLYQTGAKIHRQYAGTPYKSTLPVICVGNIVSGGAGKTPAVQALVKLLKDKNMSVNPVILLRGYGGKLAGPSLVAPQAHSVKDVGDEALLHAKHSQTIISRKRNLGAQLAELGGNDIIVMDDGLQNNSLQKDISFLVVDTAQGLGNGKLIPAGPLRESLTQALEKTDAVIALGAAPFPFETDKPVFKAQIEPVQNPEFDRPVIAFAGIGRPEKFFDSLKDCGADVIATHYFADHHLYRDKEIAPLLDQAQKAGAALYTTEKDETRLPLPLRERVQTLPVWLVFEDEPALLDLLGARLHS